MQKQYAELTAQIKELERQRKELSEKIKEDMISRREKKEMYDYGTFSVGIKRKYHYTDDYKQAESQVKEMKQQEEETVDWDETTYLTYREKTKE